MPKRVKLDRIDQKILRTLQANGRISNVDLAEQAGLSAPPCLRRVRALEEAGYIRSYHADLNAEKLGYSISAHVMVSLANQTEAELAAFEAQVQAMPQVRQCILLSGDVDYLLQIVAEDWDRYQQFLTSQLESLPNVKGIRSMLAIRSVKDEPGVPVTG